MAKKPDVAGYFDYSKYLSYISDQFGGDSVVPDLFAEVFRPNGKIGIKEILGEELHDALSRGNAVLALTKDQKNQLDHFGDYAYNKMLDYGTDDDYARLRREVLKFVDKKKPKGKKIIVIMPSDEYIVEK